MITEVGLVGTWLIYLASVCLTIAAIVAAVMYCFRNTKE